MNTFGESRGVAPLILNLGTRWRWMVSFTPQPLYHQRKRTQYPMARRLDEPHGPARGGEGRKYQPSGL
jgi:hypothetical protein